MAHTAELLNRVRVALGGVGEGDLGDGARGLLGALGYRSPKTLDAPADPRRFVEQIGADPARLPHLDRWREVRFLFQLTGDELPALSRGRDPATGEAYQRGAIDSFVFLAVDGGAADWSRRELVAATRTLNRAFAMPVILLFRLRDTATLAVIDRRPHRRDGARDVVGGRVSLIKDVDLAHPHRAHLEILADLSLSALAAAHPVADFRGLYDAWLATLSAAELNKRFYDELVRWFAWAATHADVTFPRGQGTGEGAKEVALIRLLTRLMFTWFIKEKGLVPAALFDRPSLAGLLHEAPDETPDGHGYYLAILQNLFFATLNTEMGARGWRRDSVRGSADYLGHHVYRHAAMFRDEAAALAAFAPVPFLNGGLFECLDVPIVDGEDERAALAEMEGRTRVLRVDGFSDQTPKQPRLPNRLFFGGARGVDLSAWFPGRQRPRDVPGLIDLFERYKFTVEENTPLEEEAALDPELLGKVFENLLASYNADTRTTARAKSGSFYTPREVVDFMVDEALVAWLLPRLQPELDLGGIRPRAPGLDFGPGAGELALEGRSGIPGQARGDEAGLSTVIPATEPGSRLHPDEEKLRHALDYAATGHAFSEAQADAIIAAIERCRAIDPAVGSGAFPLGLLQKLVHLLGLLDPGGAKWRDRNRAYYLDRVARADEVLAPAEREAALTSAQAELDRFDAAFASGHYPDYTRKLFLIERVLHGVDVQPIAVQIAKLRCFISLAVEQRVDDAAENRGVTPLPNLETKFVAANTLTPLHRQGQGGLISGELRAAQERLRGANRAFFAAANSAAKRAAQDRITGLRDEIARLVRQEDVYPPHEAALLARWNPFDPNSSAPFFDAEWMFGLQPSADEGWFDLVLANPPYVRQEKIEGFTVGGRQVLHKAALRRDYPGAYAGTADLFVYFYERSLRLLKPEGALAFITSNKWYRAGYGAGLRRWLPREARILKLVDFGDAPVFEAIAYPTILVATRRGAGSPPSDAEQMRVLNWTRGDDPARFAERVATDGFAMPVSALQPGGWQFEPQAERDLLARLRAGGAPLGEWCEGRFYYGIKTGLNEAFVLNEAEHAALIFDPANAEVIKPFLRGRDVKRWQVQPANKWLIFARQGVDIDRYPAIRAHLEGFRERLEPKPRNWNGDSWPGRKAGSYRWYELQDTVAYWEQFDQPKIIVPAIEDEVAYAPDREGFYSNDKTSIIVTERLSFLLGVLNSSTSWWLTKQDFSSKEGGYYEFKPMYVGKLPVPPATPVQEAALSLVVDAIVAGAQRPRLEALINAMVYELFFPDLVRGVFAAADAAGLGRLADLADPALARAADDWSRHLADPAHPLYAALFDLQALDVVRIIEGR